MSHRISGLFQLYGMNSDQKGRQKSLLALNIMFPSGIRNIFIEIIKPSYGWCKLLAYFGYLFWYNLFFHVTYTDVVFNVCSVQTYCVVMLLSLHGKSHETFNTHRTLSTRASWSWHVNVLNVNWLATSVRTHMCEFVCPNCRGHFSNLNLSKCIFSALFFFWLMFCNLSFGAPICVQVQQTNCAQISHHSPLQR